MYVHSWSAVHTSHCKCTLQGASLSLYLMYQGQSLAHGSCYNLLFNTWVKELCVKLEEIFLTRSLFSCCPAWMPEVNLEWRIGLGTPKLICLLSNLEVYNPATSRTTKPQKYWRWKDCSLSGSRHGPRVREMLAFTAKEHFPSVSCSCWTFVRPKAQKLSLTTLRNV